MKKLIMILILIMTFGITIIGCGGDFPGKSDITITMQTGKVYKCKSCEIEITEAISWEFDKFVIKDINDENKWVIHEIYKQDIKKIEIALPKYFNRQTVE